MAERLASLLGVRPVDRPLAGLEAALERAAQLLPAYPQLVAGPAWLDVHDAHVGAPTPVTAGVGLRLIEGP
jgi:hypothetical protein